jgi:hypothetical protein
MRVPDADQPFRSALEQLPTALEASFSALVAQGPLPLEGADVTRAILLRLSAFYEAQTRIKEFLAKRYSTSASDFFVETVTFYLKALVLTHGLNIEVESERQVRRARGAMRPDISLWNGDRCVACIECKTQLGWNRSGWEAQFLERERRLIADFTGAATYLVVLTADNWPGFGDNPQLGRKYFLLSNVWPTRIDFEDLASALVAPIEGLLRQICEIGRQR